MFGILKGSSLFLIIFTDDMEKNEMGLSFHSYLVVKGGPILS
jgi:hypothetical protein